MAYGLSKCLAEDLCAGFTARTGIPVVALRPVWVWDPGMYQRIEAQWLLRRRKRSRLAAALQMVGPRRRSARPGLTIGWLVSGSSGGPGHWLLVRGFAVAGARPW
jgi:hypothetical protein